jgi:hypothetical protein
MSFEIPKPIEQNYENGSSAVIVDIRDSPEIVRKKSYSKLSGEYNKALKEHTGFMMQLFKCVFDYIESLSLGDNFSFNDTGDGCLCVFWNTNHPLTCMKVASVIHNHLSMDEYVKKNNIRFGIGLHTGGCLIYRTSVPIKRDFVFGIVANTAARVEKFTKNLKDGRKNQQDDPRLVFTGNFKKYLKPLLKDEDKKQILPISKYRLYINDGRNEGHFLYTMPVRHIECYANQQVATAAHKRAKTSHTKTHF